MTSYLVLPMLALCTGFLGIVGIYLGFRPTERKEKYLRSVYQSVV